jgi:hypothetical protein
MINYSVGDKVHIFLTWGAFSKNTNLQAKDIVFLAEGTITQEKEIGKQYFVRIDKIFLDITDGLREIGQISRWDCLWVERGEEAWNLWNTPSNRFAKVE